MRRQVEVRVLGGFPALARFDVAPAEPDIGIWDAHVTDIALFTLRGRPATFVERRMRDADWRRLEEELVREASERYD